MNHQTKFLRLSPLLILGLSGCAGGPAEAPAPQDIILMVLGFLLFTATLVYAAYKAFVELNVSYTEEDRSEAKSRAFGFFIGILLTSLIIAADTETSPFSTSRMMALFPWYIFSCLGALLGFTIALASALLSYFRGTSGMEMITLVLSFIGSTGLYLSLFSGDLQATIFTFFVSILIGLFTFRMLIPDSLLERPAPEEARQ